MHIVYAHNVHIVHPDNELRARDRGLYAQTIYMGYATYRADLCESCVLFGTVLGL